MSQCVICGARTGPYSKTCDAICRRARKNGLTRQEEIVKEESEEKYPEHDGTGCPVCGCHYCMCDKYE